MIRPLLIGAVVVSIVISPFAKRQSSKHLLPYEALILNVGIVILFAVLALSGFFIVFHSRKNNFIRDGWYAHVHTRHLLWAAFGGVASVIAWFSLVELSRSDEVTRFLPYISPISLILSLVVAIVVFSERVSYMHTIGYACLVFGLLIVATADYRIAQ